MIGNKGASYDVAETAFQQSLGVNVPIWDWLSKKVPIEQVQCDGPGYPSVPDISNCNIVPDEDGLVERPELNYFAVAMPAAGNAYGASHAFGKPELQPFRQWRSPNIRRLPLG